MVRGHDYEIHMKLRRLDGGWDNPILAVQRNNTTIRSHRTESVAADTTLSNHSKCLFWFSGGITRLCNERVLVRTRLSPDTPGVDTVYTTILFKESKSLLFTWVLIQTHDVYTIGSCIRRYRGVLVCTCNCHTPMQRSAGHH